MSGRLDPYPDPDCGCIVVTIFHGHLQGGTIEGRYSTTHVGDGRIVSGTWSVRRKRT